jgi:hypothetical protein
MRKTFIPFIIILAAVLVVSCSPKKSAKSAGPLTLSIKPDSTAISGDLGPYLEVTEANYDIVGNNVVDIDMTIKVSAKAAMHRIGD